VHDEETPTFEILGDEKKSDGYFKYSEDISTEKSTLKHFLNKHSPPSKNTASYFRKVEQGSKGGQSNPKS
jgi:hypothetical protein